MHSRWFLKKSIVLILFISMIALFIQSCGPSQVNAMVPTPTFAVLDSVTCPQVTPVAYPSEKKPRVIYILIDRSSSYGRYTKRAMDVLIEGLEESVESGDRLYLIWLGADESPGHSSLPTDPTLPKKYLLVETVPVVSPPLLIPSISTFTPTALPATISTPTTIPQVDESIPDLKKLELAKTATAASIQWTATANSSSIIATNAAIQVENQINQLRCDQTSINNKNLRIIEEWEKHKEEIVEDFIEEIFEPLKNMHPQANDNATHLYNSLFYVARTIRDEKDTNLFGSYYLIILSDMQDVGSKDGEELFVDLTDVNVLMAVVSCDPSIECQIRGNYWEKYFKGHGALLPTNPFRLVDETTPYVISDFFQISGGSK